MIFSWLASLRDCFDLRMKARNSDAVGVPAISAPYNVYRSPDDSAFSITDRGLTTDKQRCIEQPGLQFMSDIHLERYQYQPFEVLKQAPHLILAGDIGRFKDGDSLLAFLRLQCAAFQRVIFVPGNHEFYGLSREEGLRVAGDFENRLGENFILMNRRRLDLEGGKLIVLGCTLHSYIPPDTPLTNDFEQIRDWRVESHNAQFWKDRAWLQEALANINRSLPRSRVIIVTHYAPAFGLTTHPKHEKSTRRYCFCSDTLDLLRTWDGAEQVTHWVFGHTHYNTLFERNGIMVVSNQRADDECVRKFDNEATI